MAALTLGDGLRGKGRPVLFLVQESEHLCWKSHVNENTILAGGWCWNPFSTVPRISHTFSLFVLLSCHFLLWKSRKISSDGAGYTQYPTWQLPALFSTPPSSLQTFTAESSPCIHIKPVIWPWRSKALTVCFQLPCHPLIPLFSVYSRILVRKYILGWLIPPHLISAAGWWLPAVLRCIDVLRTILENKLRRCYKSDG